jgi:hypothetical protein
MGCQAARGLLRDRHGGKPDRHVVQSRCKDPIAGERRARRGRLAAEGDVEEKRTDWSCVAAGVNGWGREKGRGVAVILWN